MKINIKPFLPHLLALVIFIGISMVFFHPSLSGYSLKAHDVTTYKGMSKELIDFRNETGEEALWTNSMFGGMPATQISVEGGGAITSFTRMLYLGLPHPINKLLLTMISFYILLLSFKVDFKLAIIGAIGFSLSSYFIIILQAGHMTKSLAIAEMSFVLAGVVYAYRNKMILGAGIFGLGLALEIAANHLQITYYLALIVLFFVLSELYRHIQNNQIKKFIITSLVLLGVMVLSVGTNAVNLWGTIEYGKYTTRGKSELKTEGKNQTTGLDKDYVTAWSYGTGETFSLLLPFVKGGGSVTLAELHPEAVSLDNLEAQSGELNPQSANQVISQIPNESSYWGNQGFTSGNVYVGAIFVYLFLLSLVFIKDKSKWFLLLIMIITIGLSWGKNMMWLSDLFLDYVPGYNKFRAPSMILVVAELIIPLLGMLFLNYLFKNKEEFKVKITWFYFVTGGLVLFLVVLASLPETFFNFFPSGQGELTLDYIEKVKPELNAQQQMGIVQFYNSEYYPFLKNVRISIFQSDIFRTLAFIILSGIVLLAFTFDKINKTVLTIILGLLILIDIWSVDVNYLNNIDYDNDGKFWVENNESQVPYSISAGDEQIFNAELGQNQMALAEIKQKIKDKNDEREDGLTKKEVDAIRFGVLNKYTNFRVYSLSNPYNESRTSYFYKSLGGYHGAKLKRYQELIDSCLRYNNVEVINMLNAKYVVEYRTDQNGRKQTMTQTNPQALGNAWLVNNVKIVANANEELDALKIENGFKARDIAVVDQKFKSLVKNDISIDPKGFIKMNSYAPNKITYTFSANSEQVAVFSEIFYDLGWKAFIDGKAVDHFRANYILRGLKIPAGDHKIEFRYELNSFKTSKIIQPIAFILILLILGFGIYKKGQVTEE